jgi:hypothetical protein
VCGLLAVAPRFGSGGLGRALPIISGVAFVVVIVQLFDPPPIVSDSDLATGAWLALAATATMAGGAILGAASISVTVDVRGRERRRRTAAIDARESAAAEAEPVEAAEADLARPRRFGRGEPLLEPREPEIAEPEEDPQRTQALDPVEPTTKE